MQVSRSGQIRRPCSRMSSPVLTTAVMSCAGGVVLAETERGLEPEEEPGATDAADQHHDLHDRGQGLSLAEDCRSNVVCTCWEGVKRSASTYER